MDTRHEQQSFHVVTESPWPLLAAVCLCSNMTQTLLFWNWQMFSVWAVSQSVIGCLCVFGHWFYDVVTEATYEGQHTVSVQSGIRSGMLLFILSEVMFFFSFFWAFFHFVLVSPVNVGHVWPPLGILSLDPTALPLVNTILLLSSGVAITWGHRSIEIGHRHQSINALVLTIIYGIFFSIIQLHEYHITIYSLYDSVYGTCFYLLTGFHGLHIVVGTVFLVVCLVRLISYHYTSNHHVGYVCCIWYWHFVDVVWLFLYIIVYIWATPDMEVLSLTHEMYPHLTNQNLARQTTRVPWIRASLHIYT